MLIDAKPGKARITAMLERVDAPDIELAIDFVLEPPRMPEKPAAIDTAKIAPDRAFSDMVDLMHNREEFLRCIETNMRQLSAALTERLEDSAGWHGEKRRDDAERALKRLGTDGRPSNDPDWPRS